MLQGSRLTDGGEVASLFAGRPLLPESWYSFLLEAEWTVRAIVQLKGLGQN
jgi:hypothetical protein